MPASFGVPPFLMRQLRSIAVSSSINVIHDLGILGGSSNSVLPGEFKTHQADTDWLLVIRHTAEAESSAATASSFSFWIQKEKEKGFFFSVHSRYFRYFLDPLTGLTISTVCFNICLKPTNTTFEKLLVMKIMIPKCCQF